MKTLIMAALLGLTLIAAPASAQIRQPGPPPGAPAGPSQEAWNQLYWQTLDAQQYNMQQQYKGRPDFGASAPLWGGNARHGWLTPGWGYPRR